MTTFGGFSENDFSGILGTTWRGRGSLGGILSTSLRSYIGEDSQSWGVRRRPELHLAKKSKYDSNNPRSSAKLFVYAGVSERRELAYGFYVESAKVVDDAKFPHWGNFRDLIRTPGFFSEFLSSPLKEYDLIVSDYYDGRTNGGSLGGTFRCHRGQLQWSEHIKEGSEVVWEDCSEREIIERLVEMRGKKEWIDLHIFAKMGMAEACVLGSGIEKPILSVLESLVPLYKKVVSDPHR